MKNALAAIVLALAVTLAVAGPLAWRVAHDDAKPTSEPPALLRADVEEDD